MSTLQKLQKIMAERKISKYILPKNDEFFCTNLPISKDRLRSVTNFTGSSGYAVIG